VGGTPKGGNALINIRQEIREWLHIFTNKEKEVDEKQTQHAGGKKKEDRSRLKSYWKGEGLFGMFIKRSAWRRSKGKEDANGDGVEKRAVTSAGQSFFAKTKKRNRMSLTPAQGTGEKKERRLGQSRTETRPTNQGTTSFSLGKKGMGALTVPRKREAGEDLFKGADGA